MATNGQKKLSIVSIAAEVSPFSKTGGLGDVTRSLPKSLKRLGHAVTIITPFYRQTMDPKEHNLEKVFEDIPIQIPEKFETTFSVYKGELMRGLPIYFIMCEQFFGKLKNLYGSEYDNQRFYAFDVAALKLITLLDLAPDIIHCHDWHTGLIPEILKKQFSSETKLTNAATVFTIHNLAFQLGHDWWGIRGPKRDRGITPLPPFENTREIERINFTKRAILQADVVNAVSETYAQEILERNYGQDLHRILKNRESKLFGVVNGIDHLEYNPARDPGLKMNYDDTKAHRKQINKLELQKRYKLEKDERAFVIVMTSRIAEQKGFDILLPVIPALMTQRIQFVFMGDGDKEYIKQLSKLTKQFEHRIVHVSFSEHEHDETMLYAGGDVALFPSRFEPCGTGQLKSLRYGCVPIARKIGGLSDTVEDFDYSQALGNGFVFQEYTSEELLVAISRAYAHFQHRPSWRSLVIRGMRQSNSWELPARIYVELYRRALKFKNNND